MKTKSTGMFGARYGRKIRHKIAEILNQQKRSYKCPYCNQVKVKRQSAGIWQCKKCNAKFAGKAYTLGKKIPIRESPEAE